MQASHVYVRRGGRLPPLSPLYVGPYEVLERTDKCFRLAVGGRGETVSIAASGSRAFYVGPPGGTRPPPTSAPVVFQPQHPPAAATTGGTVAEDINM